MGLIMCYERNICESPTISLTSQLSTSTKSKDKNKKGAKCCNALEMLKLLVGKT
jgi:hypothetical protein